MLDDGVMIICRGLVLSVVIAFILTLVDYGKFRGWSDARTSTVVVLIVLALVGIAEYARLRGLW